MYANGSFTQKTPGSYFLDSVVYPLMNTVGWNRVSSNVVSAPWNWNVYQSPGTINAIGNTWYLALGYDTASNSKLCITAFESWNVASNQALYFAPYGGPAPLSNGQVNIAVANCNSSVLPNVSPNVAFIFSNTAQSHCLNTTGVNTYWLHYSIDEIIIATSNSGLGGNVLGGVCWYAGMYDSFMANTLDITPITVINIPCNLPKNITVGSADDTWYGFSGGPTIGGFCLREPNPTGAYSGNFASGVSFPGTTVSLSSAAASYSQPEGYSNKYFISKGIIIGRGVNGGGGITAYRGSTRYIWYVPNYKYLNNSNNLNSFNRGDQITFYDAGVSHNAVCIFSYWNVGVGATTPMNGNYNIFMETV